MPDISFWKREFGLHGFLWRLLLEAAVAVALVVALWSVMGYVRSGQATEQALGATIVKATASQVEAEVALIHLLEGGVLMTDTDFIQCRMRDRASTLLKNGRLP